MIKPRNWHNVFPLSLIMFGFWIGEHFDHTFDVWCTVIAIQMYGVIVGWQVNSSIVIERGRLAKWETPPETPALARDGKTYANPNGPELDNGFVPLRNVTYRAATVTVQERDPRIIQWCHAIAYNNTPMIQSKWAGRKRLFSKPEYVRWIGGLLKAGVIVPVNAKSNSSTYKPNGAAGWKKIKDIADRRDYIPLPTAELTEKDTQFLRAQMRRAV